MKISDIHKAVKQPISFEIFPPKGELDIDSLKGLLGSVKALSPAFVSVTYSAGGSGKSEKTCAIAAMMKNEFDINSVAHLTCINSRKSEIEKEIVTLKTSGIENILALRGDYADGAVPGEFKHASQLIPMLKDEGFCVGAACYPESHIECDSEDEDILHLKEKQDAGADFFVSQLFFDNECFYRFSEKCDKAGITVPISAGIMPILSKAQISRMIFMCGASLPAAIVKLLYKYESSPDALRLAGIEYAAEQIKGLLSHGVSGIHIYTMNQPDIAENILKRI